MSKAQYGPELSPVNDTPLPYMPVYYRKKTTAGLAVVLPLFFVGTIMLSVIPPTQKLLLLTALGVELLSVIILFFIARKALILRTKTARFLVYSSTDFLEAASHRYGITLTETMVWNLAHGGKARVYSSSEELIQIMILSDPVTQTTKVITVK